MPWPSPAWTQPGSSPLTRGKRALDLPVKVGDGLIPTHAGKTLSSLVAVRARGAHPRSCGENTYQNVTDAATDGSSPLMRGKHRDLAGQQHGRGLIPAHAGKTPCRVQRAWSSRAHPRSRGENGKVATSATEVQGSSPLTRGKLVDAVARAVGEGLIPAHAGKT